MKLIKKEIDGHGAGFAVLVPEEDEDMWHAYNLIAVQDRVRTATYRKVKKETSTGTVASKEKKKFNITIQVESIDFEPEDGSLRLSGRNVVENDFVKMGAFHTVDIALQRQFTLHKTEWDEIALERLEEATDVVKRAEVAALMIDEGVANVYLLTQSMTILRWHYDCAIPRKRIGSHTQHDAALAKFFGAVMDGVLRNVDLSQLKCFIFAGPGFVKEQFYKHLMQQAVLLEEKRIMDNKDKIMLTGASSVHKHALKEVLMDKRVLEQMADTKAAKEVQALNRFYAMLQNEPDRATYGLKPVQRANETSAIEVLMISDDLFRAQDIQKRAMFVKLMQDIKSYGGEVKIFSSMHVSGQQLTQLSGVAAILRFPIPGLDDDDEDEEDDSEFSEGDIPANTNRAEAKE